MRSPKPLAADRGTVAPAWATVLRQRLDRWAGTAPDRAACADEHRAFDWASLRDEVVRVRGALHFMAGDALRNARPATPVVAIHLRNGVDLALTAFGAATLGAAFELLPMDLADDTLRTLIDASPAAIIVTEHPQLLAGQTDRQRFVSPGALRQVQPSSGADPVLPAGVDADQVFSIVYSSGTTGTPKGIVHAHDARHAVCGAMAALGVNEQAAMLVALPMANNLAFVTWFSTVVNGGRLVILDGFEPRAFCSAIASHRVTHFALTPAQYRGLLASQEPERHDLSSLKMHLSSSARLWPDEKREIAGRMPGRFCEIYGVTEGGVGTLLDCSRTDKLHTVGAPIGMYDMKIIDDAGQPLLPGEVGRIVGRAAFMMSRYLDLSRSASYWSPPDDPSVRYLIPGDLGCFDDDGYLLVLDRAEDTLVTATGRWYPSRIESALRAATGCRDVAVRLHLASPGGDARLGVHWVGDAGEQWAIKEWLACHVALPATVQRCKRLPRNAMGKVLRHLLA
jgi:long-chain acyl-CoA synthetase